MALDAPVAHTTPLVGRTGHAGHLADPSGRRWTWHEVLVDFENGGEASASLERAIAGSPWHGVFWECRPVLGSRLHVPFEWVVVDSPAVARLRADPRAFMEPLQEHPQGPVATFANLGGDATLVVPRPGADGERCGHLVEFLRTARSARRQALWQAVARAARSRLQRRPADPLWLSTSGLGVSWLHIRLDDRPKYYTWRPFRAPPAVR
jgi:hypothetical protein